MRLMSGGRRRWSFSLTELKLAFPHEIIDLAEEVLRSIRLGGKPAVVGMSEGVGFI
jgi:hypothetical protein